MNLDAARADRVPVAASAIATALAIAVGLSLASGGYYLEFGFIVVIILVAAISMVWPERLRLHLLAGVVPLLVIQAVLILALRSSNPLIAVTVWTVEAGLPAVGGALAGTALGRWRQSKPNRSV